MIREIWDALVRWWTPEATLPCVDALDPTDWKATRLPNPNKNIFEEANKIGLTEFAVTARPRHIPWSRRKKELEAGARQKRRQREEWRDQ